MDTYKNILKRAWKAYRSRWFINIIVVFVVSVFVGGYSMTTGTDAVTISSKITGSSNAQVLEEVANAQNVSTDVPDTTGLQYTKGALSVFVNQISASGSIVFGIVNALNTLIFKDSIKASVTMFVGTVILILILVFVKNVLVVGQCRYFMEHRIYKATKADKLMFIYRFGSVMNVIKIMLIRSI